MAKDRDTKEVAVPPKREVGQVYDYGEHANAGYEGATSADFAIPFLAILQSQSPQVTKGKPSFREDARSGQLLNTVTGELFDGEQGLVLVPCCREYKTVEWLPREKGGGLVAMHEPNSDMVLKARGAAKEFGEWKTPNGNDLVDTFYLYCLVLSDVNAEEPEGLPVVVAFNSTKIKKYKQMMSKLRAIKGGPPLYAFRIRLRSVPDSNSKGSFFNFDISPAVGQDYSESQLPPTSAVFLAGAELKKQVQGGMMKADFASQQAGNAGHAEPAF